MCSINHPPKDFDFISHAKISNNKLIQEYCQENNFVFHDYSYQEELEKFAEWVVKKVNVNRIAELEAEIKNLQEIKTMLQESFIEMSKISIEFAKLHINDRL